LQDFEIEKLQFACFFFATLPLPGDSEVIFAVLESSCHPLLLLYVPHAMVLCVWNCKLKEYFHIFHTYMTEKDKLGIFIYTYSYYFIMYFCLIFFLGQRYLR